jgi:hypothetical protein
LALSRQRAAAIIEDQALRHMSGRLAMLATMNTLFRISNVIVRCVTSWRAYSVPTSLERWEEGRGRERHRNNEGGARHSIT